MEKLKRLGLLVMTLCLLWTMSACALAVVTNQTVTLSTGVEGYRDWTNDFAQDGKYTADAEGLHSVQLLWLAGSVEVTVAGDAEVAFAETSREALAREDALRYGVEDGVLYVQYCAPDRRQLPVKNLTLTLPRALAENLQLMRADVTSADVTMTGLTARQLTFSGSSGSLTAKEMHVGTATLGATSGALCYEGAYQRLTAATSSGAIAVVGRSEAMDEGVTPGSVSLSATSGAIAFAGTYRQLTADASSGAITVESQGEAETTKLSSTSGHVRVSGATGETEVSTSSGDISGAAQTDRWLSQSTSGKLELSFAACPAKLSVGTSSGDVKLTLPAESDFTLEYHTSSGELKSDFSMMMRKDTYTCGSGAAQLTVNTTSGNCQMIAK